MIVFLNCKKNVFLKQSIKPSFKSFCLYPSGMLSSWCLNSLQYSREITKLFVQASYILDLFLNYYQFETFCIIDITLESFFEFNSDHLEASSRNKSILSVEDDIYSMAILYDLILWTIHMGYYIYTRDQDSRFQDYNKI